MHKGEYLKNKNHNINIINKMAKVTIKIEEDIANELKKKMNVRDTYSDVIKRLLK